MMFAKPRKSRRSLGRLLAFALLGMLLVGVASLPSRAAPLDELARIPVGGEPLGIGVGKNGQVITAAAAGRSVHVLDPLKLTEISRLDLSQHGRLSRVFADPDTGAVYVSASVKGKVLKLDPAAAELLSSATIGGFPQGMARVGNSLLVALTGGKVVAVLDTATLEGKAGLDAGDRPSAIFVDRDGKHFYVVKSTTRSVWVFDTASLKWARSITDAGLVRLSDLNQSPDGRLLLLDATKDALLVMDPTGTTIAQRVPLLAADCGQCTHVPMALSLSPDGTRAAIVGRGGWVSLIDLKQWRLIAARQVGRDLRGVVWAGQDRIFVTSFGTAEVVVVDGAGE